MTPWQQRQWGCHRGRARRDGPASRLDRTAAPVGVDRCARDGARRRARAAARGAPRSSLRRPRPRSCWTRAPARRPSARRAPGGGRPGRVRAGPGRVARVLDVSGRAGATDQRGRRGWRLHGRAALVGPEPRAGRDHRRDRGQRWRSVLQDSQASLVSPLPAFHAGVIDGSAFATGRRLGAGHAGVGHGRDGARGGRGVPRRLRQRLGARDRWRAGPPTDAGRLRVAVTAIGHRATARTGADRRRGMLATCPRPSTTSWWAATRGPRSQNRRRHAVTSRWSRRSSAGVSLVDDVRPSCASPA